MWQDYKKDLFAGHEKNGILYAALYFVYLLFKFIFEVLFKLCYDLIILIIIPIFNIVSIITFGIIGWLSAYLYLGFSIPFNIFAIPIKNPIELFNIFKKHSDIITILFCMAVIASFKSAMPPSTGTDSTFGIMSAGLVVVILFKLYNSLKKSV